MTLHGLKLGFKKKNIIWKVNSGGDCHETGENCHETGGNTPNPYFQESRFGIVVGVSFLIPSISMMKKRGGQKKQPRAVSIRAGIAAS